MPVHDAFSQEELLALLKDTTVAPSAIAREMEMAGAAPHPETALASARQVLARPTPDEAATFAALPPGLRDLVLECAVQARAIDFVFALCGSAEKAIAKEAKRALHRLKAAGLKIDSVRPPAERPTPPSLPPEPDLPAYASAIDGQSGERIVFLPCPVPGGFDVAQVVLSDETGISSAQLTPIDRRGFKRFTERVAATTSMLIGAVPRLYARSLIAQALDRNAVARRPIPAGFNEVAFAIGPAPPPEPSPGRTLPSPANAQTLTGEASVRALLSSPHTQSWKRRRQTPPGDPTGPRPTAENGGDDATRWSIEQRARWAERLYDMAWLFDATAQPTLRDIALAHAHWLDSEASIDELAFARSILP